MDLSITIPVMIPETIEQITLTIIGYLLAKSYKELLIKRITKLESYIPAFIIGLVIITYLKDLTWIGYGMVLSDVLQFKKIINKIRKALKELVS